MYIYVKVIVYKGHIKCCQFLLTGSSGSNPGFSFIEQEDIYKKKESIKLLCANLESANKHVLNWPQLITTFESWTSGIQDECNSLYLRRNHLLSALMKIFCTFEF